MLLQVTFFRLTLASSLLETAESFVCKWENLILRKVAFLAVLKTTRIITNLVGMMLFVQVILGGSAVFGYIDVRYHLVWGVVTFGVLIVATPYAASELGSKSTLFRTGIAAIADYVVQTILGFIALGTNSGVVVVIHLTNAFVLGVLVTYLISFADSADKASTTYYHKLKPYAEGPGYLLSNMFL